MSSHTRSILALLLLLGTVTAPAHAQNRDRGPLVLELPASTRALALGNAFQLDSRDSDAVFYHPGRVGRAQGLVASLQRFTANGTLTSLSAGQAWFGGGVALGLQNLTYGAPARAGHDVQDILGLPADEASLREPGDVGISETVVSAGYGKSLFGAEMGVVGKYVEQRFDSRKASTLAADLGMAASAGPVTLGLSVQNLGPDLSFGGGDIPLPTRFTLGASSDAAPVGPLDLAASTALSYRLDGDLVPSVGLEVGYWPITGRTFVGRVGYRYRSKEYTAWPLTFGGAFLGDDITLEYAYQGFEDGDPSHRFSVGWR
ncbi:MAG: hypothetical protein ACQET1_06780 [Gemmatimonadota bacterium]